MGLALWKFVRRILIIIVVVFLILTIDFVMFMVVPGDPYHYLLPKGASPEVADYIREHWRLDDPLAVQYVYFVKHYLTGDFGKSLSVYAGIDIEDFIYAAALRTIALVVTIGAFSILLAVLYERFALTRSRYTRKSMHFLAMVPTCISVPALALFLLCLAVRYLPDIPLRGDGVSFMWEPEPQNGVDKIWSALQHAFLPVLTGVLATFGLFVIMLRGGLRYFAVEKNIQALTSKDILKPGYFIEGLRTIKPMPKFFVSWILCYVLVIDFVFSYGGLGKVGWDGMIRMDFPVLMATYFAVSIVGLLMILALSGFMALWPELPEKEAEPQVEVRPAQPLTGAGRAPLLVRLRNLWKEYRKSWAGMIALVLFAILVLLALFAPFLATVRDPYSSSHWEPHQSPDWENPHAPSLERSQFTGYRHPLGTDYLGRDIYSMWLYGARMPIFSAVMIVIVCIVIGYLVGIVASQMADIPDSAARLMGTLFGTIGETFLAIPILVMLGFFVFVKGLGPYTASALFPLILFSWAWALIAAPLRRTVLKARKESEQLDALQAHKVIHALASNAIKARTLFIAKFVVLTGILTMTMLSFYGLFQDIENGSWGEMLESAYEWGAFATGGWAWIWIFMPLIGIGALALSMFVILHTAEKIYMRRLQQAPK